MAGRTAPQADRPRPTDKRPPTSAGVELLPQAHGFEGLAAVEVLDHPSGLAVTVGIQMSDLPTDREPVMRDLESRGPAP
jgi:hypothetical protein